jgi:hypothetical protein
MHCASMHGVKDTIQTQGIKEISRDTMWIACEFDVVQACDLFNLKDCVFPKVRYGGERDEEVIRPAPYASCNLIYFTIENDHLAIEPFKSAEAEVAIFQKSRRRNGTGVDTFDQSG